MNPFEENKPALDDDIQSALTEMNQEPTEASSSKLEDEIITPAAWNSVVFPMPITTNRFRLAHWAVKNLIWGTFEAGRKTVQLAKRKPWITVITFVGGYAFCPICQYTTGLIYAGFLCYAVKTEK